MKDKELRELLNVTRILEFDDTEYNTPMFASIERRIARLEGLKDKLDAVIEYLGIELIEKKKCFIAKVKQI